MNASVSICRPIAILLSAILTLLILGIGAPGTASARTQQWEDRQRIVDLREDASVARRQGWLFIGTAVAVVAIGVAATVVTGGAAAPAVIAGAISLISGGAGYDRFSDAKAAQRKAEILERDYRERYGREP